MMRSGACMVVQHLSIDPLSRGRHRRSDVVGGEEHWSTWAKR